MFGTLREAWESGKTNEIAWWLAHLKKTIGENEDFLSRARGESTFNFEKYIDTNAVTIKVLDVGAGPVTQLGTKHQTLDIEVTAIDPLSNEYDEILTEVGVTPVVRTTYGEAETLDKIFEPDTFDFAHCRNALDHSYNPLEGIWQTIRVLKPGAKFYLCGYINEAVEAKYLGLHQWNFDILDGRFKIWRPGVEIDVADAFGAAIEVTVVAGAHDARWYTIIFTKR